MNPPAEQRRLGQRATLDPGTGRDSRAARSTRQLLRTETGRGGRRWPSAGRQKPTGDTSKGSAAARYEPRAEGKLSHQVTVQITLSDRKRVSKETGVALNEAPQDAGHLKGRHTAESEHGNVAYAFGKSQLHQLLK